MNTRRPAPGPRRGPGDTGGHTTQTRAPRDAGSAAVEFALVVPVLLTLLFAIVTLASVFFDQLHLQAAARDAARAGSVAISRACTVATGELAANGIGTHTCTVVHDCTTGTVTIALTATSTYAVPLLGDRTVSLDATSSYVCATTGGA